MKVKMIRVAASLLLVAGLLAFSVPSYAKVVVLSYGFANSTEGFSINTMSNCGVSFSMAATGSGGLTVDAGVGAADCAGTIEFKKIVVLGAPIQQPSVTMVIRDAAGVIDPDQCRVGFGDDATPDMLIRTSTNGNSGEMVMAATIGQSIGGQIEMRISLPFHVRGGGTFQIGEINIESN